MKPIIMTGESVRAILEGRKTQTRRVVVQGLVPTVMDVLKANNGKWVWSTIGYDLHTPYGVPGDVLWVREGYALQHEVDGDAPPYSDGRPIQFTDSDGLSWLQPHYRATDPEPALCCENPRCKCCAEGEPGPHWRSPMFMPRWASRITLEVIEVRVQRVQEISEEDAIAEGCEATPITDEDIREAIENPEDESKALMVALGPGTITAKADYMMLWDAINAKRGYPWASNPFVWAISFRRIPQEAEVDK